jgi:glycosyltransferase involved in cell wall biosynthesis
MSRRTYRASAKRSLSTASVPMESSNESVASTVTLQIVEEAPIAELNGTGIDVTSAQVTIRSEEEEHVETDPSAALLTQPTPEEVFPEPQNIHGVIDGLIDAKVWGWVLDLSGSTTDLVVRCFLDGSEVASVVADIPRFDVMAAGYPTAKCGFEIRLHTVLDLIEPESVLLLESGSWQVPIVLGQLDVDRLKDQAVNLARVGQEAERLTASSDDSVLATALPPTSSREKRNNVHRIASYCDGLENGFLRGWAYNEDNPLHPVSIRCYINETLVASTIACQDRPDLGDAGLSWSSCGFEIDLRKFLTSAKEGSRLQIDVITDDGSLLIGRVTSDWSRAFCLDGHLSREKAHKFSRLCFQIIEEAMRERGERDRELPFFDGDANPNRLVPGLGGSYDGLFYPSTVPYTKRVIEGSAQLPLSGYLDHVRYRYKVDHSHHVGFSSEDINRYLQWYMEAYLKLRGWRRAPLSATELAYLNGPGVTKPATRAMSFFLPGWRSSSGAITETERGALAYWWAVDLTPTFFVEDVLVPKWCHNELQRIAPRWKKVAFPLTAFMERFFNQTTALHFLEMSLEVDRVLFYAYLIVNAMRRPDLLRYVPQRDLNHLLRSVVHDDNGAGHSFFELLSQRFGLSEPLFSHRRLRNECASRMFDLDTLTFVTMSSDGHRIAAVALPLPEDDESVEVQVIGPFQKASGLGQAARLSVQMIERAGHVTNAFDFGLDNPAPEGFSTEINRNRLKKSKINIIHLNGESVPLAFAYMPPVFRDTYNIGYFYWELDSPAACHYLSLELLDEVWVSTEYCREIYSKATSKPVINVGMCAEDSPSVPKAEARTFVCQTYEFREDDFVFLAAFDSFSFVQRKNPIGVVRAFRAAFPNQPNMRLMIKTHNREAVSDPHQIMIWRAVEEEVDADERIVIVDDTLPYADLRKLKAGVDCYVSLHKSEGWGFGMIEAMCSRTPVIATAYSGNMDFCRPDTCWLVDYDEVFLDPNDYIFVVPGQQWAEPRFSSAVEQFQLVATSPAERERRAATALEFIRKHFSESAISERYGARLRELLQTINH